MSGMDRLTDETLAVLEKWQSAMDDEILKGLQKATHADSVDTDRVVLEVTYADVQTLLAHRRASQAAPAPQKPVAWAETDHKGKVIGVGMNQYPWHPTPLYAAPAPSDGLREAAIAEALNCLAGEPEYHENGMGCGLEDRNITDRYEAMAYGWNQAMERIFAEHINPAIEALTPAPVQEGGE